MQNASFDTSLEQAATAVESLDLELIRLKLMDRVSGPGWTGERAANVEREYRDYLSALARERNAMGDIAPSRDVDEFWHAHILHTRKYAEDCGRVFGTYLHHDPRGSAFCSASARSAGSAFCSAAAERESAAFCSASVHPEAGAS